MSVNAYIAEVVRWRTPWSANRWRWRRRAAPSRIRPPRPEVSLAGRDLEQLAFRYPDKRNKHDHKQKSSDDP